MGRIILAISGGNRSGKDSLMKWITSPVTYSFDVKFDVIPEEVYQKLRSASRFAFADEVKKIVHHKFPHLDRNDKESCRPYYIKYSERAKLKNPYIWAENIPQIGDLIITDLRFIEEYFYLINLANVEVYFAHVGDCSGKLSIDYDLLVSHQ